MLILFLFFRELEHPRSNCAVLLSATGRGGVNGRMKYYRKSEGRSQEDFMVHREGEASPSYVLILTIIPVFIVDGTRRHCWFLRMTSKRASRFENSRLYKVTTAAAVTASLHAPQAFSPATTARRFLAPSAVRLISVGYAY